MKTKYPNKPGAWECIINGTKRIVSVVDVNEPERAENGCQLAKIKRKPRFRVYFNRNYYDVKDWSNQWGKRLGVASDFPWSELYLRN